MSRHRRQASQVMPPELLTGEDLTKPFDLNLVNEDRAVVGTTSATSISISVTTNQDPERETHLTIPSPATTSKKPPAGKSA
ncbi:hypothetical protein SESBI_49644 [Sesbania bispinosa]|nr:hypothetical protein SESBI_49644 [Sesbania bispinosa]